MAEQPQKSKSAFMRGTPYLQIVLMVTMVITMVMGAYFAGKNQATMPCRQSLDVVRSNCSLYCNGHREDSSCPGRCDVFADAYKNVCYGWPR